MVVNADVFDMLSLCSHNKLNHWLHPELETGVLTTGFLECFIVFAYASHYCINIICRCNAIPIGVITVNQFLYSSLKATGGITHIIWIDIMCAWVVWVCEYTFHLENLLAASMTCLLNHHDNLLFVVQ